ncbi:MAG TPA: hypothetical protein V6D23_01295, partial [Candidatus Obscuribacterales bacterium]
MTDPDLYALYLSCLALDAGQLRQMVTDLQDSASARREALELLQELKQKLEQQPLPGLAPKSLDGISLPEGLDPLLRALAQSLSQPHAPKWAQTDYQRLQQLLPRLWNPGEHQASRLQSLKARLEHHAELFGNLPLQTVCRQLTDLPPPSWPDALLRELDSSLAQATDLQAMHQRDYLTGLPGLVRLVDAFALIQHLARHHHSPLCLAIVELASFSHQETIQGPSMARLWVRSFTQQLQQVLPETVQLARWLPHRLLLLFPNLSLAGSVLLLESFYHQT